jgi:predicted RNase H-like HicB family nuclease
MEVGVCLEVGPEAAGAFVPSCPGCWVFGRNEESALEKAKGAISDWYAWMRSHGEPVEIPFTISVSANEVLHVSYNPAEAGKPEPLFWSEVLPVSTRDIKGFLRLLDYSRNDLLRLVSGFDADLLRWKPKNGPRTIGNCLRHIAMAEWWYVTRLDIGLPARFPRNTFELLSYTRELAKRNLSHLSKEKRRRIFQPKIDPSPICNLWTARKVLRRFVDHERLHTEYIKKAKEQYDNGSRNRLA